MIPLDQIYYGNSLASWVLALLVTVGTTVGMYLLRMIAVRRMKAWSRRTDTPIDDVITDIFTRTRFFFFFAIGVYVGLQFVELPPRPTRIVDNLIVIIVLLQAGIWGNRAIALWLKRGRLRPQTADAAGSYTMRAAGFIARVLLWSVLVLMVLDNLGFNITTLVASLGIGGVAIALAVQNILGDIFASLSIALDKPFEIGDFIIVGDYLGSVEYIGLKTTRLRSLSGEQVILSNADLLQSRIRNYKRMFERRVLFEFGVVYQTNYDKLRRIPEIVKAAVEQQPKTRFDRAHFKEYGDSALVFEVVYYVQDADYNVYMDIHQAILLELFRRLPQESVEFAYPTRTLYIQPAGGTASVPRP